jgi:hypothetical protein
VGVVIHSCNPSTQEAEAEGLRVQGQPGLHSKTLFQKIKGRKNIQKKSSSKQQQRQPCSNLAG